MKIEIAENMLYSWLRHCKCCQIVQTNFKASSFWPKNNEQEMEALFNLFQADERFSNFRYTGYRGRLQTFDSLMKDTECDLLALAFDEGNSYKLFRIVPCPAIIIETALFRTLQYGVTKATEVAGYNKAYRG
ncbi:hypothetical protein [Fibrobacter succinogenes]|uniref:hypothetical protein n=1 Tax=Fibrobacter succinogenes TaxID=833 RepID=UPI001567362E|nr:hypothetical protein [Fibrobacter succinogenes]